MEVEVSELYKIWLILISYVVFMSTLVAFVYEKIIHITFRSVGN